MSVSFRPSQIVLTTLGAVIAVSCLAYAANFWSLMLLGSFGASALLVFALPEVPLSQPRNVVGGHILSSGIALVCLHFLGAEGWAMGLATGLGIGLMMATRTLHPPAGSNAIIIFLSKPTWGLLLGSAAVGSVSLVLLAAAYHRSTRRHQYPVYWRKPKPLPAAV